MMPEIVRESGTYAFLARPTSAAAVNEVPYLASDPSTPLKYKRKRGEHWNDQHPQTVLVTTRRREGRENDRRRDDAKRDEALPSRLDVADE